MRKLRLIYANSATRVMSPSELSRQAEEVQSLLYQLKEQGVKFPGRMRDHVAEACKISASKLARLHAIRANLDSNLLIYFDRGDLNEDAAYKLTQLPADIQFAVGQELINGRRKKCPSGVVVSAVLSNLDRYLHEDLRCRAHAGGPDCHYRTERIVRSVFAQYDWNICSPNQCCMDCLHAAEGCSGACREAKDKVKLEKRAAEERQKTNEANRRSHNELGLIAEARRFLPLVLAQEWPDDMKIPGAWMRELTVAQLRAHADGDFKAGYHFPWEHELVGTTIRDVEALASSLGCTTDFVLGRSNDPHGSKKKARAVEDAGPYGWRRGGTPEAECYCAVYLTLYDKALPAPRVLWWDGEAWCNSVGDDIRQRRIDKALHVERWFPLP